eukprot:3115156-Prymnesium_polylepis.1
MRGVPMWQLAGGTDALANVHIATCPRMTRVSRAWCWRIQRQFNRFSETSTAIARRLLGVVSTTTSPSSSRSSGAGRAAGAAQNCTACW